MALVDVVTSIADRFGIVLIVTLVAGIPLGVLVAYVLGRHRIRRGWARDAAWRSAIAEVGMVVGTLPWVWMIMTPTGGAGGLQFVPFRDLLRVLAGDDAVVQLVGNLLVFAALGFFFPVRFRLGRPSMVVPIVTLVAAALSAVLEMLQLVLHLGRVTSVDDVIVNAAGAAIASLLSIAWWRSRRAPHDAPIDLASSAPRDPRAAA
ncbi:MAG: VanZ family protein [Microbacterium enclense]